MTTQAARLQAFEKREKNASITQNCKVIEAFFFALCAQASEPLAFRSKKKHNAVTSFWKKFASIRVAF